jgi:hypothetical protein
MPNCVRGMESVYYSSAGCFLEGHFEINKRICDGNFKLLVIESFFRFSLILYAIRALSRVKEVVSVSGQYCTIPIARKALVVSFRGNLLSDRLVIRIPISLVNLKEYSDLLGSSVILE